MTTRRGYVVAAYRHRGYRVRRVFPDEPSAEAWLALEERLVREDRAGARIWTHPDVRPGHDVSDGGLPSDRPPLFTDYADAWLATLHRRDGAVLRGGTRRRLTYIVSLLKDAFPPPMLLRDLDPIVIRDWYENRRPQSDWSFRDCCIELNAMLRDAADPYREDGRLIEHNPWRLPVPPAPEIPSHDAPPVTPQQLAGLYDAFPDYTRASVLLVALAGGMRTSEVCALRVGDIDIEHRILSVRFSLSRGADDHGELRLGPTKTPRSHRTVPIPTRLVPILRDHLSGNCTRDPSSPLFVSRRGGFVSPRTLSHHMIQARESVDRPDLTFRMLRASHASLYMLEGGTLRETMDQLGHASERVAVRSYQRVVVDHRRDIADRLADMMLADSPDALPIHPPVEPSGTVTGVLAELDASMDRLEQLLASRLGAGPGADHDQR